ncbi:hypothetical protein PISL3812_02025 [Talaromyces islandicus]|uniref:Uncharacterized protein n=1 Tax=Talaromyces islandicus TaxID=28573 RepID=A0A0U1LNP9_TALIS|nr:hypothetical protein PISL3812_02025 [Talaromyces islandicus]
MEPPFPSLTATWHNVSYPAISPLRPELSAAGKTVVIIGAGSGIGRATAASFDRAGASKIILIGRNESKLKNTQKTLSCHSSTHSASVTDEQAIVSVAITVGSWDVLVLAAGYLSQPATIRDSSVGEWWQSFETNVKGSMVPVKAFLPSANPSHAAIIGLTTAVAFPATIQPGLSAYTSSKLAVVKLIEHIAAEAPSVFAAALNPGVIHTAMLEKAGGGDTGSLPVDSVELPADFMVWLTSSEASFLNGRYVYANWDINELRARAEEIQSGILLTPGINGWPFAPV